jgi:hypothetical protein
VVGGTTVLVELRVTSGPDGRLDLPAALVQIGDYSWTRLSLLLGAVVIVAMMTQAMTFSAVRLLEGYWGHRRPVSWIAACCLGRQRSRLNSLEKLLDGVTNRGLESACRNLELESSPEAAWSLNALRIGTRQGDVAPRGASGDWREHADPWWPHRRDRIIAHLEAFPTRSRLLPTRLGNLLRSVEDELTGARSGTDLENWLRLRWSALDTDLRVEHDQTRTRLDLYCTLVPAFLLLAAVAQLALLFSDVPVIERVLVTLVSAFFGVASYRSALASADDYASVLTAIEAITRPTPREPAVDITDAPSEEVASRPSPTS